MHRTVLGSARAGNVIGGGDWAIDRIVPDCIRSLANNKQIVLRNPDAVRPWQHVLDPLSGYLMLAMKMYTSGMKFAGPWNFGPDDKNSVSVDELTRLMIKSWGSGSYKTDKSVHPHEAKLLRLNIDKSVELLGWSPKYKINTAVERTVRWYKNYYSGMTKNELYEFTVNEIGSYMSFKTGAK
jgi:CDP-glucose 4,6-dehydratase